MKRALRLLAGILISVICFYFAIRGIDFASLWQVYREANYLLLIPAALLLVLINGVRAYRWRLLMYPDHHRPLRRLFSLVNIGYLFNNVLPAKAGELVRGYLAGRMLPGGIGQAFSTLVVERLLDVFSAVVILVLLIPFVALPSWATRAGLLLGGVSVGGVLALLVLARFGEQGIAWVWRFVGRVPVLGHPKLRRALSSLVDGFRVLTVWKLLPGIAISSALIWGGYAAFNYMFVFVFGLPELPFAAACFVLVATAFSMVVPSSPGAVGVFEGAAMVALSLWGLEQSRAFGYVFGFHIFTNIVMIVLGALALLWEGLSYAEVSGVLKEAKAVSSTPPTP